MEVVRNENSIGEIKTQLEHKKKLDKLESLEYSIKVLKGEKEHIERLLKGCEEEYKALQREIKMIK